MLTRVWLSISGINKLEEYTDKSGVKSYLFSGRLKRERCEIREKDVPFMVERYNMEDCTEEYLQ